MKDYFLEKPRVKFLNIRLFNTPIEMDILPSEIILDEGLPFTFAAAPTKSTVGEVYDFFQRPASWSDDYSLPIFIPIISSESLDAVLSQLQVRKELSYALPKNSTFFRLRFRTDPVPESFSALDVENLPPVAAHCQIGVRADVNVEPTVWVDIPSPVATSWHPVASNADEFHFKKWLYKRGLVLKQV